MRMLDLEVSLSCEEIDITQDVGNGEYQIIKLREEQAELFCQWVLSAAKVLRENRV